MNGDVGNSLQHDNALPVLKGGWFCLFSSGRSLPGAYEKYHSKHLPRRYTNHEGFWLFPCGRRLDFAKRLIILLCITRTGRGKGAPPVELCV